MIEEINNSDVSYVMDVGCDLSSSLQSVKNAGENEWCYAVVGIHPHEVSDIDEMEISLIEGLAKKEKVQAIGEIGLDYHYMHSTKDDQKKWFREQIRLANKLKMPIVIHSREAAKDTMDILIEEGAFSDERKGWFPKRTLSDGSQVSDARVLLHCYSGGVEQGMEYIKLGGTLSMAGPLTYKNNKKSVEVVKQIPIEYLLVETDAPYLTPEPFRGKPNESPYVEHTARRMAVIKGMDYEEVARITCENAKKFFNIR